MSEHKICYDGIKLRKIEKEESEEGSLIRLESKCALLIESLRVCKPLVEYIHFPTDILARKLEALVESLNSIDTIISKYITCIDELYETDFRNELYETDLSDEEIKYATEIVISVNKPNIWHLINSFYHGLYKHVHVCHSLQDIHSQKSPHLFPLPPEYFPVSPLPSDMSVSLPADKE